MTTDRSQQAVVYNFGYHGSLIDNTEAGLRSRKAKGFWACNKLTKFWESDHADLSRGMEVRLLGSSMEVILIL